MKHPKDATVNDVREHFANLDKLIAAGVHEEPWPLCMAWADEMSWLNYVEKHSPAIYREAVGGGNA